MKTKIKARISGIGITFVLSCFAKFLGAVYRIPLIRIIGAKAMGEFSLAFPIYAFAVTLVCAGISVNVARLILTEKFSHEGVLKKASVIFGGFGIIISLLLCLFSGVIATLTYAYEIQPVLLIMSASIPFSAFSAVLRGYFQGKNQTVITGISLCVEPILKTIVGLLLSPFLSLYGVALAVSVSEVGTSLFLFFVYIFSKKSNEGDVPSTKILLLPVLKTAIGSAVLPLSQFFDGVIVLQILSKTVSNEKGRELLGILSTVNSLIALPLQVVNSLLSSATCHFCSDKKRSNALVGSVFAVFLFASVFCSSVFIFAPTVVATLYPSLNSNQTLTAINLIKVLASYPLFFALKSVFVAYLQGVGNFLVPSLSIAIGVGVKTAIEILFTSRLGIYSSALGILLGNATAFVINGATLTKYETFLLSAKKLFIITASPLIFSVVANAFTYYSRSLFVTLVGFLVALISLVLYLYAFVFSTKKKENFKKEDEEDINERYIRLKRSKSG